MANPKKNIILIIDDEPENLKILGTQIEDAIISDIIQANNIDTGFKLAKKYLPDIIIADWNMPGGSGIELIERLKKGRKTKFIPIIIATGVMVLSEHLQTALEAGATDYLKKPYEKAELTARIKSALFISKINQARLREKDIELNEKMLTVIKNNEFNQKLINSLEKLELLKKKNQVIVDGIISEIQIKIKSDVWQKFKLRFKSASADFEKKLFEKHPNLTKSENKLSILLYLDLSTKEIASILCKAQDSVKTGRYRLRKKFNLQPREDLRNYLHSL